MPGVSRLIGAFRRQGLLTSVTEARVDFT